MPHYRCEACKARLHTGSPADFVGDLCPQCGSLLEPIADLAQLVGYRLIAARDGVTVEPRSALHQQLVNSLDEFVTRRASTLNRDRLDAERSLYDGDVPSAAAVALPPPDTYL
jgi:hypothetical protein